MELREVKCAVCSLVCVHALTSPVSCAGGGAQARDAAVRILRSGGSMTDSPVGSPGRCADQVSRMWAGGDAASSSGRLASDCAAHVASPPPSASDTAELAAEAAPQPPGEPPGEAGQAPSRLGRLAAPPAALSAAGAESGKAAASPPAARRLSGRDSGLSAVTAVAAAAEATEDSEDSAGFLTPKLDAGDDWLQRSAVKQRPRRPRQRSSVGGHMSPPATPTTPTTPSLPAIKAVSGSPPEAGGALNLSKASHCPASRPLFTASLTPQCPNCLRPKSRLRWP